MSPIGQQSPGKTETAPPPTRPGSPKGPPPAKMPPRKAWLWFLLILLANFLLSRFLLPSPNAPVTIPYTLFKEEVGKVNVQAIHSQGATITGHFKVPITYAPAPRTSPAPPTPTRRWPRRSEKPRSR